MLMPLITCACLSTHAQASELPLAELPNALTNALASFVASTSEPALVQVLVPLVHAVVAEGAGAGAAAAPQGPPGKGKAGLFVMLAVVLRTRPQALVQASGELRVAGRQLTSAAKLPLLLWVINQAALSDPLVGVAVWVRLLLPQLLGVLEVPCAAAAAAAAGKAAGKGGSTAAAAAAAAGGDPAQLLAPLEVASQGAALQYLSGGCARWAQGAGRGGGGGGAPTPQ
jgi:hypothetical protein